MPFNCWNQRNTALITDNTIEKWNQNAIFSSIKFLCNENIFVVKINKIVWLLFGMSGVFSVARQSSLELTIQIHIRDSNLAPYSAPSHYLEQCWLLSIEPLNKLQWNSNQNTKLFIRENAYENIVCEMAAILSRGDELNVSLAMLRHSTGYEVLHVSFMVTAYGRLPLY